MMKKVAGIGLALLTVAMLAVPVLAIGPDQAFDVGNNPNLMMAGGALHNNRGEAGGNVLWFVTSAGVSGKWLFFDAAEGAGKMNAAIIATISTLSQFSADSIAFLNGNPTVNENKWIYLSPEGSGNQYAFSSPNPLSALGSHGMLFWLIYLGPGARNLAITNMIVAQYLNGVFWNYNFVKLP